ncbi:MAG: hypothetical protein ACRD38_12975 [Nitrososphaerales archaeon]
MYNFGLLTITTLLFIANNGDTDNDLFHTSADLALKTIHEAEDAGANVTELIASFNEALNLMEQAEKSNFDTCSSYEDCSQQAITILVKITDDGHVLKEQAKETYVLHRFASFSIYAPVTAFTTSVIGYLFLRAWKANQVKRLLEMEIKQK